MIRDGKEIGKMSDGSDAVGNRTATWSVYSAGPGGGFGRSSGGTSFMFGGGWPPGVSVSGGFGFGF